jgi:hypothetical protein
MEGFHLRQIAGEMIAVPTGPVATKLSGLAVLNETAHFLFTLLQTEQSEESLVEAMLNEYDTDRDTALADVRAFIADLREAGLLIEKEESK